MKQSGFYVPSLAKQNIKMQWFFSAGLEVRWGWEGLKADMVKVI